MHLILPSSNVPSNPSVPTGSLFIGSLAAVQDTDLLRQHRITHIVQVVNVPWLPVTEQDGYRCYKISIDDTENVDLRPHLESACAFIERALRSGMNVLVHCQQGVSRSASIVIAYLIRNQNMSFDSAYSFLKHKRACVKPNPSFVKALQEWEQLWRRPAPPTRRVTS